MPSTPNKTEDDTYDLQFPSDLGSKDVGAKNSIALFQARLKKGKEFSYNIYLPAPVGLSVSDQANYNSEDFGFSGAALKGGTGALSQSFQVGVKKAGKIGLVGVEDSQIDKAFGTITNPNTNSTFGGSGIRSFTFTYKFIPETEDESYQIRRIIRRFKGLSYAALGHSDKSSDPASLILTYPPVWNISFLIQNEGGGFSQNIFMPKIFECYLTTVETNYNPTANVFHAGGAPNEIDLTVTYQETRALTRNDIDALENELDQVGSFNQPETDKKVLPKKFSRVAGRIKNSNPRNINRDNVTSAIRKKIRGGRRQ